jgi:hypothetical protein
MFNKAHVYGFIAGVAAVGVWHYFKPLPVIPKKS